MFSRSIYALGLATLAYLIAEKYYNKGQRDTIRSMMNFMQEHPQMTFEEFLKECED